MLEAVLRWAHRLVDEQVALVWPDGFLNSLSCSCLYTWMDQQSHSNIRKPLRPRGDCWQRWWEPQLSLRSFTCGTWGRWRNNGSLFLCASLLKNKTKKKNKAKETNEWVNRVDNEGLCCLSRMSVLMMSCSQITGSSLTPALLSKGMLSYIVN